MSDWPLAVDMDGTLLEVDVLAEGLKRAPYLLLAAPVILLIGGRPLLKRIVARNAKLDVNALPLRADLVAWLKQEQAGGRVVVLATAADRETAERVAVRVGVFSRVFASEGRVNLKSRAKGEALAEAFPDGFVYAGDSRADLAVWRRAKGAVMVNASPQLRAQVLAMRVMIENQFAVKGSARG